jgi:hypothetical protein
LNILGKWDVSCHFLEGTGARMVRFKVTSILLTTVDTGTLLTASRQFTTISPKIVDLDALLNAQLLTRSGRKLVLTDAG